MVIHAEGREPHETRRCLSNHRACQTSSRTAIPPRPQALPSLQDLCVHQPADRRPSSPRPGLLTSCRSRSSSLTSPPPPPPTLPSYHRRRCLSRPQSSLQASHTRARRLRIRKVSFRLRPLPPTPTPFLSGSPTPPSHHTTQCTHPRRVLAPPAAEAISLVLRPCSHSLLFLFPTTTTTTL